MKDFEPNSSSSSRVLDELITEAKEHLDVPQGGTADAEVGIDWSRLEARLMASVEEEKPALLRDLSRSRSRDALLRGAAVVLAVAAGLALFVRRDQEVVQGPSSLQVASASSLRSAEGAGEVRVGGVVATPGYVIHANDAIIVDGARAVFERTQKVTWLLEQAGVSARDGVFNTAAQGTPAAHAYVKSAGEPLILGLEDGVIEAQVVPVPTGEAFAVDIQTARGLVRVAVHGTHLRVARTGDHVVVDLTEGVVSIGVPPRTGVTYGTLVTAPAHVELDATDLSTLRVDHAPESVRAAVHLGGSDGTSTRVEGAAASPSVAEAPLSPVATLKDKEAPPTLIGTAIPAAKMVDAPRAVVVPPREALVAAVRSCAAARSRSGDVRVTITSNLRLRVSASGVVESAQFSPPLSPEIQTCAAEVIYKTKLEETGLVTVPIAITY